MRIFNWRILAQILVSYIFMKRETWKGGLCGLLWLCLTVGIIVPFSSGAAVIVPAVMQRNYDAAKQRYNSIQSERRRGGVAIGPSLL